MTMGYRNAGRPSTSWGTGIPSSTSRRTAGSPSTTRRRQGDGEALRAGEEELPLRPGRERRHGDGQDQHARPDGDRQRQGAGVLHGRGAEGSLEGKGGRGVRAAVDGGPGDRAALRKDVGASDW